MDRRISARGQTDVHLLAHHGAGTEACRALDLSPSGALVRGRREHSPLVQAFELQLGAQRRKPLRVLARTVWQQDGLRGVRFVDLTDVDRLEIAEYLDALSA